MKKAPIDIFIYTDFGGGLGHPDVQTRGELASAAWKSTLQKTLWINDGAVPLSPERAAYALESTFPYVKGENRSDIHTIVMHVIDPGVGNTDGKPAAHPRALALRKDGVLFIGPDNGTLSFVCSPGSLTGMWEIDARAITSISHTDVLAGGTFHGRDIFLEAACRIAAGTHTCDDMATAYLAPGIKNRFARVEHTPAQPIVFERVTTQRFEVPAHDDIFSQAFLLGVVQSPLLADSKQLFIVPHDNNNLIVIVNTLTGNIFIGPDTGVGTSFFKGYPAGSCQFFPANCQPQESEFLGGDESVVRDDSGRPKELRARIWIDAYGNIKTTAQSTILDQARRNGATVTAELNGLQKQVIFAETFSQVPVGTLFIYSGSSAVMGLNPRRSNRYVEISANGTFGMFGIDFFKNNNKNPAVGQEIVLYFLYNDNNN